MFSNKCSHSHASHQPLSGKLVKFAQICMWFSYWILNPKFMPGTDLKPVPFPAHGCYAKIPRALAYKAITQEGKVAFYYCSFPAWGTCVPFRKSPKTPNVECGPDQSAMDTRGHLDFDCHMAMGKQCWLDSYDNGSIVMEELHYFLELLSEIVGNKTSWWLQFSWTISILQYQAQRR